MNPKWRAFLLVAMLAILTGPVFSQNLPRQAGVSVQLPVTRDAVAIPNADSPDALIVELTADGATYLGVDRVAASALADRVKARLTGRTDKTLYIKADARVPYARVVEVMDAGRNSGVEFLTFLTEQQDTGARPVTLNGLEMRLVNSRP